MTEPTEQEPVISLANVAAEPPEESVRREQEIVGDHPDVGRLVPPDRAQ